MCVLVGVIIRKCMVMGGGEGLGMKEGGVERLVEGMGEGGG